MDQEDSYRSAHGLPEINEGDLVLHLLPAAEKAKYDQMVPPKTTGRARQAAPNSEEESGGASP
jgi:hypothetical protein